MTTSHNMAGPPSDEITLCRARLEDISFFERQIELEENARGGPECVRPIDKPVESTENSPPWYEAVAATRAGGAVGVATWYRRYWTWTGRTVCLRSLHVLPTARRQGIGRRLFMEICRLALGENAQLEWHQPRDDATARAFFSQFQPTHNQIFDDLLTLTMPLDVIQAIGNSESSQSTNKPRLKNTFETKEEAITEPVTVRLGGRSDMAFLNSVIHDLAVMQGEPDGPELTEKDLVEDGFSSMPWFFALVAERSGELVGVVIGNRQCPLRARSLYLQGLYVLPSARRCGVADRLVAEFCRLAVADGAEDVQLHVDGENAPAMALYRRLRAVVARSLDRHSLFRLNRQQLKLLVTQTNLITAV